MSRFSVCVTAALAALMGGVVVAATSGAQGAGPPQGTLDLVMPERGSSFRFVDNPPLRRESAGDMAVLDGPVMNAGGGAAGRVQARTSWRPRAATSSAGPGARCPAP